MKRHYDKQFMKDIEKRLHELNKMEESKYIKERQEIDIHYVGYDIEGLKSVIKELEAQTIYCGNIFPTKILKKLKIKWKK